VTTPHRADIFKNITVQPITSRNIIEEAMPTAKAKIGDVLLAETDVWENVEGNVYVHANPPKTSELQLILHESSSRQQPSKTNQLLWELIQPHSAHGRGMHNIIRSSLEVSDALALMLYRRF
jgi:hypothetical protein